MNDTNTNIIEKVLQQEDTLPTRQESFIYHYINSGNAKESAIKAGYGVKGARTAGYRLLRREDVSLRINKIQSQIRDKFDLKAENALKMTLDAMSWCKERGAHGAYMTGLGYALEQVGAIKRGSQVNVLQNVQRGWAEEFKDKTPEELKHYGKYGKWPR